MNLLQDFKAYLLGSPVPTSALTIKNYAADIRKFISWFEHEYNQEFAPTAVTEASISLFKNSQLQHASAASVNRYISSLRKFYGYLEAQQLLYSNPFTVTHSSPPTIDLWKTKEFKDYLYTQKASPVTIKNYLSDLEHFKKWFEQKTLMSDNSQIKEVINLEYISPALLESYRNGLFEVLHFSPASVNRKLSSIRKYIAFGEKVGLLPSGIHANNIKTSKLALQDLTTKTSIAQTSDIGPKSPIAKLLSPYSNLEGKAAQLVAEKINESTTKLLIVPDINTSKRVADPLQVSNIKKDFYAPHALTTSHFSLWEKASHHLKNTRPAWYKKYHSLPAVHYIHFAALIIASTGVGYILFQDLFTKPSAYPTQALTEATRVMSFQGRLTDTNGNPITTTQDLRFSLYNDPDASGSSLLWQEVQASVKPDSIGVFSVTLGRYTALTESLLKNNAAPYLGITIGKDSELSPRQRITTIPHAGNAAKLSGMSVITDNPASSANVILALDSSGKLTIGGASNPVFQAIGGEFRLTGNNLVLATNADSNTDVILAPDGFGKIDLQKALVNSTDNGSVTPGAIEVHDKLTVVATESAVAAFIVDNQSYGGDIFAASRSGITKFVINTDGNVGIGTSAPSSKLEVEGDIALSGDLIVSGTRYILPKADGEKNSYLMTDGNGTLSWTDNLGHITQNNGVLSLADTNATFLIGGSSTDSAKFAFINSSTPQLKVSGDILLSSVAGTTRKIGANNGNSLEIGNSNTAHLLLQQSGNVGIGTANPIAKLDVNGTIRLDLPLTGTGNALCHSNASTASQTIVDCSSTPMADYMEIYSVEQDVSEGDIVGVGSEYVRTQDGDRITKLTKSTRTSQRGVIGIASNPLKAGDFNSIGYNIQSNDNPFPIALSGRVYVKVSNDSPPLIPGDSITPSQEAGKGTKASESSFIVGKALESWTPASGHDRVLVFVERGWHQSVALSGDGTIEEDYTESYTQDLYDGVTYRPSVTYRVRNELGQLSSAVGLFAKAFIGELEAGAIRTNTLAVKKSASFGGTLTANLISAQKVFVTELEIGSENVRIAGKSLNDYISDEVTTQLSNIDSLTTPLASIGILQTDMISPMTDAEIQLRFNQSSLAIQNQNNKTVAQIDNEGNVYAEGSITARSASFNGQVAAASITSTGDVYTDGTIIAESASIAGTLTADRIAANTIDGLDEKVARSADQYISNRIEEDQNTYDGLQSGELELSEVTTQSYSSFSAQLAVISEDLMSLGTTTLNELSVYGTARIGQNFEISGNSLNVIGEDLNIQPLRLGGVNFLAGLVNIDTEGNLSVEGNAYFAKDIQVKGGIGAGFITSLPGNDFIVKLGDNARRSDLSVPINLENQPKFVIENASGSAVVTFNQDGDVSASGSGTFSKLNLNFVSEALAVNDLEAVATGSAGIATLKANRPEITIQNKLVTKDSLIYITPTGNTEGSVLYLLRQSPGQSFTVGTNAQNVTDLPFNWIIVN